MSHSPPVPPGNQSPYPLQTAPQEHTATPPDVASKRSAPQDEPILSGAALGVGLAIGLGSAALFAAWFFSGGEKKSKPAARKPRAKAAATGGRPKAASGGRPKAAARTSTERSRTAPTRRRKTTTEDK